MKILVIGGMHGNEMLGIELVRLFQKQPVNQVDTLLANERAIVANCRFIEQDLNRSFSGNSRGANYEIRRAAEIIRKTMRYDVVLDFHNTYCPDNDCGFIGEGAKDILTATASLLGLTKIIVADYDCINKAANNCLSVEISRGGSLDEVQLWYERIAMLSRLDSFIAKADVQRFRFVYRMTIQDKERLQLDKQDLRAFQPLSDELADAMGVSSPAYPIFIGDSFTPYNYGGLLNKINV